MVLMVAGLGLALGALVLPPPAGRLEAAGAVAPDWRAHLRRVDEALAADNVRLAVEAWRQAQGAALESLRWESMLEVGDSYLRIGDLLDFRRAFLAATRANYLIALFRARQQRSPEGVLRVAEAFGALGDAAEVELCLAIAESLRGADAGPGERPGPPRS